MRRDGETNDGGRLFLDLSFINLVPSPAGTERWARWGCGCRTLDGCFQISVLAHEHVVGGIATVMLIRHKDTSRDGLWKEDLSVVQSEQMQRQWVEGDHFRRCEAVGWG